MKFSGIPVLYIPGNSGSHKQVRSMASVALRFVEEFPFLLRFGSSVRLSVTKDLASICLLVLIFSYWMFVARGKSPTLFLIRFYMIGKRWTSQITRCISTTSPSIFPRSTQPCTVLCLNNRLALCLVRCCAWTTG